MIDRQGPSNLLFQEERGGAAIYSAGDVKFYGKAYFLGNGFYEPDGAYSFAGPGGAVVNIGYMEVRGPLTREFSTSYRAGVSQARDANTR